MNYSTYKTIAIILNNPNLSIHFLNGMDSREIVSNFKIHFKDINLRNVEFNEVNQDLRKYILDNEMMNTKGYSC